jgi:predicted PurR-regulated permease PerM
MPAVDRSIVGYLIAGIVLSLFVGVIASVFPSALSFFSSLFNSAHQIGMGNTSTITQVQVSVGNKTVALDEPSNPALKSHFDLVVKVLYVVANILGNPLTLAILIALTIVTLVLSRR